MPFWDDVVQILDKKYVPFLEFGLLKPTSLIGNPP